MNSPALVTVLGARGSVPVCGKEFAHYGGATTCVMVRLAGQVVVLDAGTGLLDLPRVLLPEERTIPVLLTHPHVDHLMGLTMGPMLLRPDSEMQVYAVTRNGIDAEGQVRTLMRPPLWPVGPEMLPTKLTFHDLPARMELGPVTVESMEGEHPGGVTLLCLSGQGKRVVFRTDCILSPQERPRLLEFARDCDLLLCDGQYNPREWEEKAGFGHNTWMDVARFGLECGAKQVRVIHHDPTHTDVELDEAAEAVAEIHPGCTFAWAREEVTL